jgi:hypothetical protein
MLISKINLDTSLLNIISDMIIDNVFLINIFNEGICITQNINNLSNLSIFINKSSIEDYYNTNEVSYVTKDLLLLNDLQIEKIDNNYKINKQISIINDPCNVCKKLINLNFTKTNIKYSDLNLSDKINFLDGNEFDIIISNQFNGIVLKTIKNNLTLYLNILYSN